MNRIINVKYDPKEVARWGQESAEEITSDLKKILHDWDPEAVTIFTPFDIQTMPEDDIAVNVDMMLEVMKNNGHDDWIDALLHDLQMKYGSTDIEVGSDSNVSEDSISTEGR